MEQLFFIIAIASLGIAAVIFIGKILTEGLGGSTFKVSQKSVKVMLSFFALYIVTFAVYMFISN